MPDRRRLSEELEFFRDLGFQDVFLRAPMPPPELVAGSMPDLPSLERFLADCRRCRLSGSRTRIVFGAGNPRADLMFVGEAPGREEDEQGLPFVGAAGALLTRIIEAMGTTRDDVYIVNTVRCRPPDNRNPEKDEVAACRPFLEEQIRLIQPKVVVTLGKFATQVLLDTTDGITRLRGKVYPFINGSVLVPTYHPAAALRGGGDVLAQMRADFVRAKQELAKAC